MKLIFENWRRYINESIQIDKGTERLLAMLVNLKKFKSTEDFIARTKLVVNDKGDTLNFTLLIDNKLAGMVNYLILEKDANCRPQPYQSNKTYMLINIAREGSFKGFGIGRLISFLSACYVNSIGGSITSDRNTSDKAGKQLVDSLKMIGAKQSKEFDYVGHFVNALRDRFLDSKGSLKPGPSDYVRPRSGKTGIASITRGIHNTRLTTQFNKEFPELVKNVLDHLKPLTPQKNDDCEPSNNIIIANGVSFKRILRDKSLPAFLEKVLTMSSQELQEFFSSDERVQGFTFMLPKMMIDAGKEIMNAIDASSKLSDEEKLDISSSGEDMFKNVYKDEIGSLGRARKEES